MSSFHVLISPEMADCLLEIKPSPSDLAPKSRPRQSVILNRRTFFCRQGETYFLGGIHRGGRAVTQVPISLYYFPLVHTHTQRRIDETAALFALFCMRSLGLFERSRLEAANERYSPPTHHPAGHPTASWQQI
jgi:hypothetical protein